MRDLISAAAFAVWFGIIALQTDRDTRQEMIGASAFLFVAWVLAVFFERVVRPLQVWAAPRPMTFWLWALGVKRASPAFWLGRAVRILIGRKRTRWRATGCRPRSAKAHR